MNTRLFGWMCLCGLALALGCKTGPKQIEEHAEMAAHGHLPGIDCPLQKAGVDPGQLRPFAEVEKYIEFLDRAERNAWQKPDEVVQAVGLKNGETLYDLGAGSGYFSFRFARAVPGARVIAADLEPEMIRHIHHKASLEGIPNLSPVLVKTGDPQVPSDADVIFVCDVLHHVSDRAHWLRRLTSEMKSGARLVLIEFKEDKLPEGPPESAKIPRTELLQLVTRSGLQPQAEKPELLPYQVFLVFRKP
jgi:ubiquinone/menaquinone biosynthesis C-methylase UbiE